MNAVVLCQRVRFEDDVTQKCALVAGFKKGYEHFPQCYQDYNGNLLGFLLFILGFNPPK